MRVVISEKQRKKKERNLTAKNICNKTIYKKGKTKRKNMIMRKKIKSRL